MSSLEGRCGSCDAASYTAREVKHLDAANKEMEFCAGFRRRRDVSGVEELQSRQVGI